MFVFDAFRRIPKRYFEAPTVAHLRAFGEQLVVNRGGFAGTGGPKLFVRELDLEAAGIVFTYFLVGVFHRGPVAIARDVHRPNICARIAVDHPVGEAETYAAALRETSHNRDRTPITGHAAHRADHRVSVRTEDERTIDRLANPRFGKGRKMFEDFF